MTETRDLDSITAALELIDQGLGDLVHRDLISSTEVADLLLDVRGLLSSLDDDQIAVGSN